MHNEKTVLLYAPGTNPSEDDGVKRVAELIAANASLASDVDYTIQEKGESVSIPGRQKEVLEIRPIEYQAQLDYPREGQSNTDKWALLRSVRFATLAGFRLAGALRRPAKTFRAKVQLALACFGVFLLIASILFIAVAVLLAWNPSWLPEWMTIDGSIPRVVWGSSAAICAAVFWWARPKVLAASSVVRALMRYMENQRDSESVANEFDRVFDKVTQENPGVKVHVLTYSFGGIVALDAICPRVPQPVRKPLDSVVSLVTVGCPVDFIRLLYPDHFGEERVCRKRDIPWTNVFIPADVFGSNFLDHNDQGAATLAADVNREPFSIAGFTPTQNLAVGDRKVSLVKMLSLEGFALHEGYWDAKERAAYIDRVVDQWVPLAV